MPKRISICNYLLPVLILFLINWYNNGKFQTIGMSSSLHRKIKDFGQWERNVIFRQMQNIDKYTLRTIFLTDVTTKTKVDRKNELLFNQKIWRLLSAVSSNKGNSMRVGAANSTYSCYRELFITELWKPGRSLWAAENDFCRTNI